MIISGEKLRLYFYKSGNKNSLGCFQNLTEIRNEKYGYNLEVGQKIYALRYTDTGHGTYFFAEIKDISEEGLTINERLFGEKNIFVPWEKEFPQYEKMILCKLYIEPCEKLFEKNKMADILTGNIKNECRWGKGIWYKHGGSRGESRFEENLKNFVKIGQLELPIKAN